TVPRWRKCGWAMASCRTLRWQIQGAIGCVSLVEKRVLNAGSDGGNQCDGANSSHFLPALPLLDRRRLSLRHPRFTASVRQRGYTLGQNLTYEARGAAGKFSQKPKQKQELKKTKVDVLGTISHPAALIAKSSGIAAVIATGSGDPVAAGLVASLARPGGIVTGLSDVATTLSTKRLSLLKELLPQVRRVAMLWNKGDRGMSLRYEAS